ncbi:DUF418 domain-containing protein [Luteimonas sp. SX5]|uniref:DUF418 domain-containing protein n=1 Tax=Luteimonas galliterrae TaxID=2940486 RepID=A0ABT0MLB4_9GAMM|nr:DUF418 domain-containing protein [Luteimonas galliterrae]MCL1635672.1 DUF418 domain-containing protein [Luteimonas galliterrae]
MTDTAASAITPIPVAERYDLVDALRGFALCGVLLANLSAFSLYEYLAQPAQAALPTADFDRIAKHALQWMLTHKAVTVFSILFGFGFAMQLERAEARGGDGLRVFARRMGVLLAIGALHSAFWWGDILLVYALAGFALILCRKWPSHWLIWGGFAIALAGTTAVRAWFASVSRAGPLSRQEVMTQAFDALSEPSLSSALAGNAGLLQWWYPLGGLMLVLFSLGRFMLGYWAGRTRLLQAPAEHLPLLKRILAWTLPLGLLATALQFWAEPVRAALPWLSKGLGMHAWMALVAFAGPLLLGIAVGTLFVLLYLRAGWRRWLRHFAPAGRMALTNYLMQTAVCSAIFYGYGLGIGPGYGTVAWFVVWALLFSAQMAVSRWWLMRFRFGPMEWLWRSLTYGRLQPMRSAVLASP